MSLDDWTKSPDLPDGWTLEPEYRGEDVRWILTKDNDITVWAESTPVSLSMDNKEFIKQMTMYKTRMIYRALAMDKNINSVKEV